MNDEIRRDPKIPRDDELSEKKVEEGMQLIEQAKEIMRDTAIPLFIRKMRVKKILKTDNWVKKIMDQLGIEEK